jgi:hypothetical protein
MMISQESQNENRSVRGGHPSAACRTFSASLRAKFHHFVVAHALAIISTLGAHICANVADLRVKV